MVTIWPQLSTKNTMTLAKMLQGNISVIFIPKYCKHGNNFGGLTVFHFMPPESESIMHTQSVLTNAANYIYYRFLKINYSKYLDCGKIKPRICIAKRDNLNSK